MATRPANSVLDNLAWRLHAAGRPAAVLLDRDDGRFRNVPRYHYGESAGRLAALVRRAA